MTTQEVLSALTPLIVPAVALLVAFIGGVAWLINRYRKDTEKALKRMDEAEAERDREADEKRRVQQKAFDEQQAIQRTMQAKQLELERQTEEFARFKVTAERRESEKNAQLSTINVEMAALRERYFKLEERLSLMRDTYDQERVERDERERLAREKSDEALDMERDLRIGAERERDALKGELKQREIQIAALNQRIDDMVKLNLEQNGRFEATIALRVAEAAAPLNAKIIILEERIKALTPSPVETEDKAA